MQTIGTNLNTLNQIRLKRVVRAGSFSNNYMPINDFEVNK